MTLTTDAARLADQADLIDAPAAAQIVVHRQASVVPTQQLYVDDWSRERMDLLKRTYAKGATDDEFALFISTCKRLKLSPEARQIWNVPRKTKDFASGQYINVRDTMVSIDGLRLIAERTGQYEGQARTEWCGQDGVWREVWLEDAPPFAARVGVFRAGFREPLYRVAKFKAFVQNSPLWTKMPDHMLAKVAEALALRAAFPNECADVYTAEEMGQAHEERQDAAVRAQVIESKPVTEPPDMLAPQGFNTPVLWYKKHPRYREDERKRPCALVSELSDDELIAWTRGVNTMLEGHLAKGTDEDKIAYYTKALAELKAYAATRNITDFSKGKEERSAELKAAIVDAKPAAEEPLPPTIDELCLYIGPEEVEEQDVRKWTNLEGLLHYSTWLGEGSDPHKLLRQECIEARLAQLVEAEQAAAEAALDKHA